VRSATGDALTRYADGEYDRAISGLMVLGGFNTPQADEWIALGGPGGQQRRRLVAAVLALEYTAARPGLSPQLIEWAAKTLRDSPEPQAHEPLWLRASIALAEGRRAWAVLNGLPGAKPGSVDADSTDPLVGYGHLAYALTRSPDNPHFRLAKVVGAEVQAAVAAGGALTSGVRGGFQDRIDAEVLHESAWSGPQAKLLEQAIAAAEPLVGDTIVGAEAHLRRGYLQTRLGRRDAAMRDFDAIQPPAADPFVQYLGHLFAGWTLARIGDADAAIARDQAALTVAPQARSATTLLTGLLIRHGRAAEAESIVGAFLAQSAAPDPWREYLNGDYRAYPDLVGRLREAVR
jgi:tetratricopeptide (TPR) repeat protein